MWRNVSDHFDVSRGTSRDARLNKFASVIVRARAVRAFVRWRSSCCDNCACVSTIISPSLLPPSQTNRRAVLATLTRHWRGDVLIGTRNASIPPRVVSHPPPPLPLTVYTTAVRCNRDYWVLSASVFWTCMHSPWCNLLFPAISTWNSLPERLVKCGTVQTFKRHLDRTDISKFITYQ